MTGAQSCKERHTRMEEKKEVKTELGTENGECLKVNEEKKKTEYEYIYDYGDYDNPRESLGFIIGVVLIHAIFTFMNSSMFLDLFYDKFAGSAASTNDVFMIKAANIVVILFVVVLILMFIAVIIMFLFGLITKRLSRTKISAVGVIITFHLVLFVGLAYRIP